MPTITINLSVANGTRLQDAMTSHLGRPATLADVENHVKDVLKGVVARHEHTQALIAAGNTVTPLDFE